MRKLVLSDILNSTSIQAFGSAPTVCAVAPGRVNLSGEHTDYNGGFVFPMALPMVTAVVGAPVDGSDEAVVVTSEGTGCDAPFRSEFRVEGLKREEGARPKWANYVKGDVANFHGKVGGIRAAVAAPIASFAPLDSSLRCS